eukprot:5783238-Prymnesium_polylepis.1
MHLVGRHTACTTETQRKAIAPVHRRGRRLLPRARVSRLRHRGPLLSLRRKSALTVRSAARGLMAAMPAAVGPAKPARP